MADMKLLYELNNVDRRNPVEILKVIVRRYPEMEWLTGSVQASPELGEYRLDGKTLGEIFYPHLDEKSLIEFNRTAVGILSFVWAFYGMYEEFTACQKPKDRLTPESFNKLVTFARVIAHFPEAFEAIIVYMVINDLGKIQSVVDRIAMSTGVRDVDHDKVLRIGLELHPEISPSFQSLWPMFQHQILTGLQADFNLGQFVQGENVAASLEGISRMNREARDMFLLHALFDTAGARGQSVQNGSVVMNEDTYRNFQLAINVLGNEGSENPGNLYSRYIELRTNQLRLRDYKYPSYVVFGVARLCCMLRISKPEDAKLVRNAFVSLPIHVQQLLDSELIVTGTSVSHAILIYYAPAFLVNLIKKMGAEPGTQAYTDALTLGFTTLARVFQEARTAIKDRQGPGVYTVMALSLANFAGESPELLNHMNFVLKPVGNDAEIVLEPSKAITPVPAS
ncbi:hypothetical protein KBC70_01415 [Candidatus Woesebacteria bacterium]|nr:hypothetical protein [Candidatus Woesebacteria bacterium]